MAKPSDEQRLLRKVAEIAQSEGRSATRWELQDALGFGDDKYLRLRSKLVEEGRLKPAMGPGERVSPGAKYTSRKVFLSYSHADEAHKERFIAHLSPLIRKNMIKIWHDRSISVGEKWSEKIQIELASADIVIFLVSPDFINSDFCYSSEMMLALKNSRSRGVHIFPILLRSCFWKSTPLADFQFANANMKAVLSAQCADDAFADIVEKIHAKLEAA